MKRTIFTVVTLLLVVVAVAQEKAFTIALDKISSEAIAVTITISFAGVVRWIEKRVMKRRLKKEG